MSNVIAFRREECSDSWRRQELQQIVAALGPVLRADPSRAWETGTTEAGDPQFYLLRQEPDETCDVCISRVGSVYVLEDGAGRVLFDGANLATLGERAVAFLRHDRGQIIASLMLAWVGIRHFVHDKVEALMAEGEDVLIHVAPQFAAFV
jgi:hypothetical protein